MKSTLLLLKTICYLFITVILVNKTYSQSGTLDASFGNGGKVQTFDSSYTSLLTSCIQKDGKIILGGSTNNKDGNSPRFTLMRYLSNGNIDSSFGLNGKAILDSLGNSAAKSIILQSDGKILAGGFSYQSSINGSFFEFALVRFLPNGEVDSVFGTNGVTITSFENSTDAFALSIALQTDSKIVVAGILLNQYHNIALVRYDPSGKLDSAFGINGKVQTYENDIYDNPVVIILNNGKLLISASESGITFFRYNKNGSPDSTFGNNGKVQTQISNYGGYMILQKNTKIIVTGDTSVSGKSNMMLAAFKLNGQIDSSFGISGKTTIDFSSKTTGSSLAIDSNENIIAVGTENFGFDSSFFALARVHENGAVDSAFGNGGKVTIGFENLFNTATSVLVQPDNKIVVSGRTDTKYFQSDEIENSAIARVNNDNVLPLSFLSFNTTKQNQSVLLNWQTTNEINNNYFSVERSSNNKNFSEINKVYSTNNPSKINFYNATDLQPLKGWNYYRLKQVDKDGKFTYSSIASVLFSSDEIITIYPNPAKNFIYVDGLKEAVPTQLSIVDINGKVVAVINTTSSQYKFNIQNLAAGTYYINIKQDAATTKQQFVKQ